MENSVFHVTKHSKSNNQPIQMVIGGPQPSKQKIQIDECEIDAPYYSTYGALDFATKITDRPWRRTFLLLAPPFFNLFE